MILDRNIAWKRMVRRIPWTEFHLGQHVHTIAVADSDTPDTPGNALYFDDNGAVGAQLIATNDSNANSIITTSTNEVGGIHTGAPLIGQLASTGLGGLLIGAAGDMVTTIDLVTPTLIDITKEIGVRVLWCNPIIGEAADDITWIVLYDQADEGDALITPATALDTTIGQQANLGGTALKMHASSRGIISANKFDSVARRGVLSWLIEADAMTYSADEVAFLGLEIDYMPMLTVGGGQTELEFSMRAAT